MLALREVRDTARAAGLAMGDRLGVLEDFGAAHNEPAWAGRLNSILGFVVGVERPMDHPPARLDLRPYASGLAMDGGDPGPQTSIAVELFWPSGQRLTWPAELAGLKTSTPDLISLGADGAVTAKAPGEALLSAQVLGVSGLLTLPVASAGLVPVTFEVTVPASTPAGAVVHISGSPGALGVWDGVGVALALSPEGRWRGSVALPPGTAFEFKATRGSWATVEKTADGDEIANRKATAEGATLVQLTVAAWAQ